MRAVSFDYLPSDRDSSGRSFGEEELELLREVIESGNLWSIPGNITPRFEREFEQMFGTAHARAVSSGSAAMHTCYAAVDVAPGDEIVTTPITDMGAISPILYQGAIPVYADVDPETMNITADTIRPRITDRTRAIAVTHLFGNPCDMDPILELAREHGLPVIEDAAQAFLATYRGRLCGTLGDIAGFSFQQGKHMTTGEGGMVVAQDDALAHRARQWSNKGWDYEAPSPDHDFLGLNYRMTEMQAAVGLAQLRKLPAMVEARLASVGILLDRLSDVPGVRPARVLEDATCVWWRIPILVDVDATGVTPAQIEARLKKVKVWAKAGYISRPTFMCRQFTEKRTFRDTWWPYAAHGAPLPPETAEEYPGAVDALRRVVVIPWTEHHHEEHAEYVAEMIREAIDAPAGRVADGSGP